MYLNYWLQCGVLFVGLRLCYSTLSKGDKVSSGSHQGSALQVPWSSSVYDRGLVSENIKWKDVAQNYLSYFEDTSIKRFNGTVLGYVTPWNNHGYDVAKTFSNKFDYIAPVWLQIRRVSAGTQTTFQVTGSHDIDKDWVNALRQKSVQVLPRVLFEGWTGSDYNQLFSNLNEVSNLAKTLVSFIKNNNFNGVVLEIWSQFGGQAKKPLSKVIVKICNAFHAENLVVVLVIPPPVYFGETPGMFVKDDFNTLVKEVDAFSLMTYDYSNAQRPGPNSPLSWVRNCVRTLVPSDDDENRSKIFLGLNFYGNEYTSVGGGPIVGSQYIEILQKNKPKIKFEDASGEHVIEYKIGNSKRLVYFPTLHSIQLRLNLASELRTGLSIWELGQGLDYFYDLL